VIVEEGLKLETLIQTSSSSTSVIILPTSDDGEERKIDRDVVEINRLLLNDSLPNTKHV
jgi:hypothetical protein